MVLTPPVPVVESAAERFSLASPVLLLVENQPLANPETIMGHDCHYFLNKPTSCSQKQTAQSNDSDHSLARPTGERLVALSTSVGGLFGQTGAAYVHRLQRLHEAGGALARRQAFLAGTLGVEFVAFTVVVREEAVPAPAAGPVVCVVEVEDVAVGTRPLDVEFEALLALLMVVHLLQQDPLH